MIDDGSVRGTARRVVASVLLAGALGVTGAAGPAAAAPAVRGELLPVPAGGPGRQVSVTAVDVSPFGVVAGAAQITTTGPDGTASFADLPQRWAEVPRAGWLRQQLPLPGGATSGRVSGLTDLGEAAGSVTGEGTRAVRWSLDGRSATLLAADRSSVDAVGPSGPWGVSTATAQSPAAGEAELVTRGGVRTPLRGTPELDAGYRRSVGSIGGPATALVWVTDGIGRGATARPVLWRDGATVGFPVVNSFLLGNTCVSPVRPDGSLVYSGYVLEGGRPSFTFVRHTGGVPGADVTLSFAAVPGQPVGGLVCTPGLTSNSLASDGGIAGFLSDAAGRRSAAYWDAADVPTVVPLVAGEESAAGVAAADGGRMVILAQQDDGTSRLWLWRAGVRTRLLTPAGWDVASVVELTDAGLLVANLRDARGFLRPAAWRLGG
ncbi:hypothetical protein GCM10020358_26360 [Amorphoplanes nipponensis]|uniref:Secreted protein n=1 Tax=Actinoplanes nipponensis TaxID=135950 RepID=A0A919MSV9_9ACTN|nr:hypothetical protein [Actinoplanes nipponensis]GIE52983.1 hypothetical protein Ani05nite_65170 [Actinoplanes nipponensis]